MLDFVLENLDLDEDLEIFSDIFIDKEKDGLFVQEEDISCFDEESKGIIEIPRAVFIDEDNVMRVNEETHPEIPDKYHINTR